jgi:hypothetical protein
MSIQLGATGGSGGATVTPFSTVVPEPAAGLLIILGVAGMAMRRRRS